MSNTWKTELVTVEEFKALLLSHLLHGAENYDKEELFKSLLESGFPKFDKDNLGVFMKGLQCRVFMPPLAVDINDSMFYWLVCGTDAILVHKEGFSIPKR